MRLRNFLRSLVELTALPTELRRLHATLDHLRRAIGRLELRQLEAQPAGESSGQEMKVYSQWGEDGILQWLLRQVPIARKVFVEFGVENYTEANTRWLLTEHLWSGLVLDGSAAHVEYIRRDPIYWECNLKAAQAFVTRENIDTLLTEHGVTGEIGLLSIDIDGVDYWVWEAITVVRPALVAIEYNARFGPERALTVPYDPHFTRSEAHFSGICYGASIAALAALGRRKGYDLVAGNRAGNNCFFVRCDLRPAALPVLSPAEAWRPPAFREARDPDGQLSFLGPEAEAALLRTLPVVEVE